MRWLRRVSVLACGLLLVGCMGQAPALAAAHSAAAPARSTAGAATAASTGQSASPAGAQATPGPARLADPASVLPPGWQHSPDEAVTVSGDASGLHVLAASEASGYAWRTVTTLGDPGVETDLWIGQACVTASGRYAVVVYAPEQADNMAAQQGVLGRAAVVNLRTGAVRDLGGGFSIAYFDPGCGTGSQAVLTQGGWANDGSSGAAGMSTRLVVANAATGKVSAPVKVAGQVTSAVPYDGQIAAAGGRGVEEVSASGRARLLAATAAVPFRLTPDADGSLGYQVMAGNRVGLWRMASGQARQVASAAAGSVELSQVGGRTWLVGPQASKVAGLPRQWQPVDAPAVAQPSTTGTLAVVAAAAVAPVKGQHYDPATAQPAAISIQLLTGKRGPHAFKVATSAAPVPAPAGPAAKVVTTAFVGPAASSGVAAPAYTLTPGSPSTPVSADRTCAIALDDPAVQAYQPNFSQVEWAADQAVQGTLTGQRPANLYGSGLPSYSPQDLFPLPLGGVAGGGSLPAQVLLGVLTQESNLQQASTHVIQGQTANPLSSFNWYGNWIDGETIDTGLVNWSASDCGYGIGQITTGMCLAQGQNGDNECANQGTDASPTLTKTQQLAAAVDYQANIAAAAALLVQEWDALAADDIVPTVSLPVYDSNYADYIGAWYMAIWAYNSGIEPGSPEYGNTTGCIPSSTCTDSGGNWGLGYADNPINPIYPPDRPVFIGSSSSPTPVAGASYTAAWDQSHPEYWPYQEKVIAFAFDSIQLWDYSQGKDVQAFAFAHGNTPFVPHDTFCTSANHCDASAVDTSSATAPDSCQLTGDLADHCWWNQPASFPILDPTGTCLALLDCGLGQLTYAAGAADPGPEPVAAQFAQACASTLPSDAVIVGDGGQSALGCPGQNWTPQGSFTWNFASDGNGLYSSKIYFDQIGAGFGGHFWFGYAQPSDEPSQDVITGTWSPPGSVSGWTDVRVAIPSYGANADGAMYQVSPGGGLPGKNVLVDQGATAGTNTWVDLGDFDLGAGASVSLSNVTPNTVTIGVGVSGSDIAWSAAAFIPVSGPSWSYTAMGDSYSSGEGNPPYDPGTSGGCDRSNAAFGRQFAEGQAGIGPTGIQHIACSGATIANLTTTGQNGEPSQISQMTPSSQLVTVTIGGNDAGFASVLTSCLTTPTSCEDTYNSDDDNNEYNLIDSLRPKLTAAYTAMQEQAPDAKIVAVTYPNIFQPGTTCAGINNMSVNDVEFLISLTYYLDNTIAEAARDAGVYVMDERYAFLGHELCSSDPWTYDLTGALTPGEQFLDTSPLFHPTVAGQAQMATDLAAYWKALQSAQSATARGASPGSANAASPATSAAGGWVPVNLWPGMDLPTPAEADEMLAEMAKTSVLLTGYNEDDPSWNFVTRNGCDTRNRVLQREAVSPSQWPGTVPLVPSDGTCPVTEGSWQTPYDLAQTPLNFIDQDSIASTIAIDHVVPKANAWATGAAVWAASYGATAATWLMRDFSNDMSAPELLAVSSSSNSSKGDSSPDEWMPANTGMTCPYVEAWIEVKYKWDLAVSTATDANGTSELTFLQDTLASC